MKDRAERLVSEPVLIDREASYFGTAGAGLELRSKLRGNGTLILTETALVFDRHRSDEQIAIPLERINRLDVGLWHKLTTSGVPVLKVTYDGNLVFGVIISDPASWIRAIESLSAHQDRPPMVHRREIPRSEIRTFRNVAAGVLLLILFLTVVLPFFFAWMQSQTVNEVPETSQQTHTGTAG